MTVHDALSEMQVALIMRPPEKWAEMLMLEANSAASKLAKFGSPLVEFFQIVAEHYGPDADDGAVMLLIFLDFEMARNEPERKWYQLTTGRWTAKFIQKIEQSFCLSPSQFLDRAKRFVAEFPLLMNFFAQFTDQAREEFIKGGLVAIELLLRAEESPEALN